MKSTLALLVAATSASQLFDSPHMILRDVDPNDDTCWKRAYDRGVGTPLNSCDKYGDEYPSKEASLCYATCDEGYTGTATTCYQDCPEGWRNDGVDCYKPEKNYSRAPGSSHECDGCDKVAGLWYPPCKENYRAAGTMCYYNCPEGMKDVGVSCEKGRYQRGVGKVLGCTNDLEEDSGLCYTPCREGLDGVGSVCYGQCPSDTEVCG